MFATNELVLKSPQPSSRLAPVRKGGFGGSVSVAVFFVFHISFARVALFSDEQAFILFITLDWSLSGESKVILS
jgi:hypothetical protein